jgi:hypothetical protein
LVTGYPKLGFYAGAPILTAAGYAVGTVAVAAHEPRNFSDEQVVALELIAKQVSTVLELRRDSGTLTAGLVKERARAAENAVWRQTHDSLTSLPTRSVLEERIARLDEEELATDNPKAVSVLAIDLVGFGEVNLAITRDGGGQRSINFERHAPPTKVTAWPLWSHADFEHFADSDGCRIGNDPDIWLGLLPTVGVLLFCLLVAD